MTRVLMFTAEYPPDTGGIGEYVLQVVTALHDSNYDVQVAAWRAFSDTEARIDFDANQPYPIHILRSKSDWRTCLRLVREIQPDLVISNDLPLTFFVWIACRVWRVPLMVIAHGSEMRYSRTPIRQLKRFMFNTTAHIVSNSNFTVNLMTKFGVRTDHITVVHPGGDSQLRPDVDSQFLRERHQLEGKRVLLTMGSISQRKGQAIVLQALPRILAEFPDVHYVIAGRDRANGDVHALAISLGVDEHVTFVGQFDNDEKAAYFNLAEFCLIPSQNLSSGAVEGYGIVITEAALCQRTSIGTWDSGTQEAIAHEETGLLVPQGDVDAVAEAALRLLRDAALRDDLAANAHRIARAEATWQQRMVEFEQVVQSVVAQS